VAIAAGFLADKIGVRRIVILSSLLAAAGFAVFAFGPVGEDPAYFLFINCVIISMGIYSLHGVYHALGGG
jgi:MFS family permease